MKSFSTIFQSAAPALHRPPALRRSRGWLACAAGFLLAAHPLAAQYVFQQNDNGQTVTNPDGSQFTFPNNNLWTQPYQTSEDGQKNTYATAYTNWTTLTTYPDGAGVTASVNGSCHLNAGVSFQSLTLGSAGSLAIDSGNSGGAGKSAITVTMAAGGAGTIQNAGSLVIGAADQYTTITLANTLTLKGTGLYSLTVEYASIQGPGTLAINSDATLTATGGPTISAPITNAGVLESADSGGLIVTSATVTNTGTIASSGGGTLVLQGTTLNNTGAEISVDDASSASTSAAARSPAAP